MISAIQFRNFVIALFTVYRIFIVQMQIFSETKNDMLFVLLLKSQTLSPKTIPVRPHLSLVKPSDRILLSLQFDDLKIRNMCFCNYRHIYFIISFIIDLNFTALKMKHFSGFLIKIITFSLCILIKIISVYFV